MINLRIFSNFLCQYRQDLWRRENPNFPGFTCYDRSFAKDQYRRSILIIGKGAIVADELGGIWVLLSPQIFNPIIRDEFRRKNWNSTYKVFVFYFHHPCQFYPQCKLSLQALFCFHFPHFYFAFIFVVLQESTPQPFVLWCYTLKWHKQNSNQRQ